jgi:hypothetical protein
LDSTNSPKIKFIFTARPKKITQKIHSIFNDKMRDSYLIVITLEEKTKQKYLFFVSAHLKIKQNCSEHEMLFYFIAHRQLA